VYLGTPYTFNYISITYRKNVAHMKLSVLSGISHPDRWCLLTKNNPNGEITYKMEFLLMMTGIQDSRLLF
jgi:hypothetical protein